MAKSLPAYEKRETQLELIRFVADAFNNGAIAAAEAGTGVGKSFAYLLPAVEFALLNNERVVISTATINLQQQLFEKDIPLVTKTLGRPVKVVLMKGRGNYLCRRRLAETLAEPPLDDAEYGQLRKIAVWAETSETGSRSELAFLPGESIWGRVCSEGDACMGPRCGERERCFFLHLRRECADARLLVVNHHLLFADLAARRGGAGYESAVVLPPYTRVIIDEAHNIENAATSFFSRSFSRAGINRVLGRLYRKRRNRESGLIVTLKARLPAAADSGQAGIIPALKLVREWAEKTDAAALSLCGEEMTYRLTAEKAEFTGALLFPALGELRRAVAVLAGFVRNLVEGVELAGQSSSLSGEETGEDTPGGGDPAVWETRSALRRLETVESVCAAFLECGKNSADVYWIERQFGLDPWAVFNATPVDVAPLLRDALFDANRTVVCVSATLCVQMSAVSGEDDLRPVFAYWAGRCGANLSGRKLETGVFPSPFPYAKRTLLAVPSDAPPPELAEYQDFVNRAVTGLVSAAGGSALVLFTSYGALRGAFDCAAPLLEEQGIRCFRQGDDDRSRLLSAFLADQTSALFATDSFWEGIDAPGDTLRLVILCRLPFRAPSEPVFEARRELLERRGGNSFMELSLPDAVMKFKQGFGRLMRRSTDYGAVAVLDSRILRKFYGQAFIASLPGTKTSFKEFDSVLRDLENFLFS